MVRYNPKNWFGLIFQFHKSDTFRQMLPVLLLFSGFTAIMTYLYIENIETLNYKTSTRMHSLLGFVIGLLLVFRTNTAYERWWEGRKQWGAMVNSSRNFALKLNAVLPSEAKKERTFYKRMIPNYVFAFKEHLRNNYIPEEIDHDESMDLKSFEENDHKPNYIANILFNEVHRNYKNGLVSGDQLIVLDKEIRAFSDILGACERIKNTPIPYSYNIFLKKFIFVYTITLPIAMVTEFHYWSIPICAFVLYVFASLEMLAEEIEDPFGLDDNDLPTDNLSSKIKANVEAIFDQ